MTERDVPDTEMSEAGNPISTGTEPQHPIPEDNNVGNLEKSDLSEESMDTDVEAEKDMEKQRKTTEKSEMKWKTRK